jgi:hypothetical protein
LIYEKVLETLSQLVYWFQKERDKAMFYTFRQNNSSGKFIGPHIVCVEADSPAEANLMALASGFVYFNGVFDGKDCACCGDRWSEAAWQEDFTETPTYYGHSLQRKAKYRIIYRNGNVEVG